jgi:hypothetical protein
LKDNKLSKTLNQGLVATVFVHHTHLVLDEVYIPKTKSEISLFKEIQAFMFAFLEDANNYDLNNEVQSIN